MDTETILIRRVRIIDPSRQLDRVGALLLGGGEILAAGRVGAERVPDNCRVINGAGLVASPGFIDLHCHLREPGFEYKETIEAGSRAGAKGGFTTLCCMPNTDPRRWQCRSIKPGLTTRPAPLMTRQLSGTSYASRPHE